MPSTEKRTDSRLRQLGGRIEARREALGLSRQEVADALGITRMSVWRVERGVTRLPAHLLPAWARVLKAKASELLA